MSKIQPKGQGLFGTPPFTIVHYGPPGVGKTSLWAYLPNVCYIYDYSEDGIVDLYMSGQVPKPKYMQSVKDWEELVNAVINVDDDVQNIVFDSLTGMEQMCFAFHCKKYFKGDWSKEGFLAYQQGPKNAAKTDWVQLLDIMDQVRRSGVNIILIGHSTIKTFTNPDGPDYDQYVPILDKETWAQTSRWAKAILFQNYDVSIKKEGSKFKASGQANRMMWTAPGAAYVAKNRWNLEPIIDLGGSPKEAFIAFIQAYKKAWKIDEKVEQEEVVEN
jgi:hypothetical protein